MSSQRVLSRFVAACCVTLIAGASLAEDGENLPESNNVFIQEFPDGRFQIMSTTVPVTLGKRSASSALPAYPTDKLNMLSAKRIQDELELVDDQLKELDEFKLILNALRAEHV